MLRRIELKVLATVDRGDTISELAAKLDHSESYLSRAVGDLVEKGLVYTEHDGRRKRVIPSDARAVELYQDLVRQHSHIDFPELLTGKALEVLYYLDQPRTVSEIANRSDNYRNTVNRVLKRFRDRGLVGTVDGHYEFNADFDCLHEFARELTHHRHRQRLEAVAPKGTILWEDYDEFLAQTETEIDVEGFHETGLARFAVYDLLFLLTGHRYYVYSEELDAISTAALCCHTLVIDGGSRYRSYCLLLLSHVDVDEADLREQAAKYGLEDEIDVLLCYLETHGEVVDERLPEWDEFQKLAVEYEVRLS
ncbi:MULTISPECIES: MarR family transcriptional regulator [Halobacterium]|uniref:ArsR family transcription regulator n=1 Tax=Halobacterium salinarum (strain ATCC 33171 / DSM 3754 / JCM 8978 / NBRC 102687 / NCIMB 764 / 91-R6) TaxID=2597657 RepID=A0A4D6GSB6_HALS9|nr:MarR family transcriptional regulator [Halobacterium salinarum]MDL0136093.1 MarR family transcriptional regulator [Halobacterium salinarum]MDL0140478.1 MarR family transcriptional regulator [Halobacterium salinarum]MDL0141724.1 MarR family transcriptional regulator [Halobacterium salinarum]QCC44573.1 ArsR family transcription regulator [Halobacterium salinarum]TYO71789.1 MarR family protein [Halobacterium salinarum DSM 3754]